MSAPLLKLPPVPNPDAKSTRPELPSAVRADAIRAIVPYIKTGPLRAGTEPWQERVTHELVGSIVYIAGDGEDAGIYTTLTVDDILHLIDIA